LRIVDLLEKRYRDFPGLNLTYEVREAFARHSTRHDHPDIPEEFAIHAGSLLEVQATVIADEIAYDNHDIDDGLASGILCEKELMPIDLWRQAVSTIGPDYSSLPDNVRRAEGVRRLINLLVTDVIQTTRKNIKQHKIKTLQDVRECDQPLITASADLSRAKEELEAFLREKFYRHYQIMRMAKKARRFLREMFLGYVEDPHTLPSEYYDRIGDHTPLLVVCDYIAGMTDRYAEQEYRKLFQPFERM